MFDVSGVLGVLSDVFQGLGIGLEVDEGDVFEDGGVVLAAPFGVAEAMGADAGAEDEADSSFVFLVLAEGGFAPGARGVFEEWGEGGALKLRGNWEASEVCEGGEDIDEFGEGGGALVGFATRG